MKTEQIHAKLREINDRVRQKLGIPVEEIASYGTIKKVFETAIEQGDTLSDELQTVINSGILDRKEYKVLEEKAKLFDEELNKEINKAILRGELPNPKKIKDPFITNLRKKWRGRK